MKKLCAILVAMVMTLSLVACGGVDKQPVIDAFNSTTTAFDAVVNRINENAAYYPADVIDVMSQMAESLTQCKDLLESDTELTEEDVNSLITQLNDIEAWVATVESEIVEVVEAEIAAGGETGTDAEATDAGIDLSAAIESFNMIASAYDATADVVNANADAFAPEFTESMISLGQVLSEYKNLLESGYEFTEDEYNGMMEDFAAVQQWLLEVESQVFG